MNYALGSDHGGFELKTFLGELLKAGGHSVEDCGCRDRASVDYPDFAEAVCRRVLDGAADFGVLVCGTGVGMSMVANRHRGIRAALCHDEYTARMSREHNNANILCLGERVVGRGVAEGILNVWLSTEFAGGRHRIRVAKFSE